MPLPYLPKLEKCAYYKLHWRYDTTTTFFLFFHSNVSQREVSVFATLTVNSTYNSAHCYSYGSHKLYARLGTLSCDRPTFQAMTCMALKIHSLTFLRLTDYLCDNFSFCFQMWTKFHHGFFWKILPKSLKEVTLCHFHSKFDYSAIKGFYMVIDTNQLRRYHVCILMVRWVSVPFCCG